MELENMNGSVEGPISNGDGGVKEGRGKRKKTISAGEQDKNGNGSQAGKKRRRKEASTPTVERPARERKSIERFVASTEKEVKEFKIEKGAGTALKDIPNIVLKLSKRKAADDVVQSLHKILFGKRAKPHVAKANILQFSGYVWSTNEEKEKAKVKERLEKCVKESLIQISDILDLNLLKSSKKEDGVLKLFEFLESPHKTSDKPFEEKQESKVKKSKRTLIKGMKRKASGNTPRKRQKADAKTSSKDQAVDEEDGDGGAAYKDDVEEEPEENREMHSDSGDEDDYDVKPKISRKRGRKSAKKQSEEKSEIPKSSRKRGTKSAKKQSKQEIGEKQAIQPTKKKPIQEAQREEKKRKPKAEKVKEPTDEELQAAICELLQDADFSKVTFTDVLKQLGEKFKINFSHNKAHVKALIQEEIAKIVDEGDNDNGVDEDDSGEGENDNVVDEDNGEDEDDNGENKNDHGVDEDEDTSVKNEESKEDKLGVMA